MKTLHISAMVGLLALSAAQASAQSLTLEFENGRVRLNAQNVPVSQILSEWSRRGQTTIVNGERVPGPPVTLLLEGVSEQQALDVILRSASGYLVAPREASLAGASAFDRILILPTSSRPTTSSTAVPVQQPPQNLAEDFDDDPPPTPTRGVVTPNGGRIPREVEPGINNGRPNPAIVNSDENDDPESRPAPTPGNPFVTPGTSRPGVVTPGSTNQRNPNP